MSAQSTIHIQAPFPDANSLQLRFELSTCQLMLHPGEGKDWVTGTYDDLGGSLPLDIRQDGPILRISQRKTLAATLSLENRLAPLDLALGKSKPFSLFLEAAAHEGRADLGGLPLTRLEVKHATGKQEIVFTMPNPQRMKDLNIRTVAASLEVRQLANANFEEMDVDGGEADCLFDFGGTLTCPAQAKIQILKGTLEIRIPTATAARIATETLASTIELGNGYTRKGGSFWNQAALAGQNPVLTIKASVVQGTIRL